LDLIPSLRQQPFGIVGHRLPLCVRAPCRPLRCMGCMSCFQDSTLPDELTERRSAGGRRVLGHRLAWALHSGGWCQLAITQPGLRPLHEARSLPTLKVAPRSKPASPGPSRGPTCRKEPLPRGVPGGRTDPTPSAHAKHAPSRCEPRSHALPPARRTNSAPVQGLGDLPQ
jgi:hypothetical protein